MLQDEPFAADVASMFCSNIKEASDRAKMTDAAADVLSYLVGQGFRAPLGQIMAACKTGHNFEGYKAWILAHDKLSVAFSIRDADIASYGVQNSDVNQRVVTAAVIATLEANTTALEQQLSALNSPTCYLHLIPELRVICDKQLQPADADRMSKYLINLLIKKVDGDGRVQLVLQAVEGKGLIPSWGRLRCLLDFKKIPATSQQLIALLDEIFNHPNRICGLLTESEVLAGPCMPGIFNSSSKSAIMALMRRCVSTTELELRKDVLLILQTLCYVVRASSGHLANYSSTVAELVTAIADNPVMLDSEHVSHSRRLVSCLYRLPSASNMPAAAAPGLLSSLLKIYEAPKESEHFLAIFGTIIWRLGGKQNINSQMAAEILAWSQVN